MEEPPSTLTFGVMCHGTTFDDWQAQCIRELREMEGVELDLLIIDDTGDDTGGGLKGKFTALKNYSEKTDLSTAVNQAAWFLHNQPFDGPSARSQTDLSEEIETADRIHCDVREDGFSQYFYEDDLETIQSYELDFVLRFAFGIIRGEILDVPTYGVWSYHHDDERKYRGGPPCFWEIYENDPVTGAILQRLTERLDGGIILRRGFFPTIDYSYAKNLDNVYNGTTHWPAHVATDILNGHADYLDDAPTTTDAPIYRAPSPVQLARYNLERGKAIAKHLGSGIPDWNVGVLEDSITDLMDDGATGSVEWFPDTIDDGFIADPFPATIDGQTYIFVEELSYDDWQGRISYIEYPDGFENGTLEPALEEPFHLSYPYIFEFDGDTYAIPETYEANEIRLYRVDGPADWTLEQTLVSDVAAVDPTVVEYDGRWWLFFTTRAYSGTNLHVWHAPEPTGSWEPHATNPVKSDVRSARPGGTPYVDDGVLYRPAQDCRTPSEKRVVINRVADLTPEQFAEETVATFDTTSESPYPAGTHTVAAGDGITITDGCRHVYGSEMVKKRAESVLSNLPF